MEMHHHVDTDLQIYQQYTNSAGQAYCTIYVDIENKMVIDVWKGAFGKQENFQQSLMGVLEAIKKYKTHKWLADLSEMAGGFKGSEKWLQEYLMPQAEKAGIRYEAVILSKDIYSKLSAADSVKKLNDIANQGSMKMGKVEVKQFTDYPTALAWLQAK